MHSLNQVRKEELMYALRQLEDPDQLHSNFVGDSFTLLSQLTEESNNGRAATIALLKTSEGFEAITAAIINYGDDAKMQTAVASVLNSIVEKSDVTAAGSTPSTR